ncbi:sulfatase [Tautonia sociabilis]|uniref:Arylsulfatase n=1 Tax=Tautonia sociabilis TaxID=2080755 RepID=A0A432MQN1_9BACT|nr:sulfatase [Tautonia sociabilis]RUL89298.1 arylsulfatase [Tautonia sociabilis]
MLDTPREPARRRGPTPHRRFRQPLQTEGGTPRASPQVGVGDVIATGLWLGIVAGLLELATILVQGACFPVVSAESLRTNHHKGWMIPAADLATIGLLGLLLAPAAGLRGRWAGRLALFLLSWAAVLGPMLAIVGLHPVGAAALALGIASRASGRIGRLVSRNRRRAWVGLAGAAFGLGWLGFGEYRRVVRAEEKALAALPEAIPGAPNVLLLVLDTVRAENLSLYGYDRPTSPHLERLAASGITFEEARAPAPWTLPTHASLFTGRWPHELSVGSHSPLDGRDPTLAEFFSELGYSTGGFVANTYFCNARFGLDRGFSRYEDFEENARVDPIEALGNTAIGRRLVSAGRSLGLVTRPPFGPRKDASRINRDLLRWIDSRAGDGRPFFAFLNYFDAHAPYQPPAEFASRFGVEAGSPERLDPNDLRALNPLDPDPEQLDRLLRRSDALRDSYDACIASIDAQIGRLCDELASRGLLDDSWLVITSDHGEHFGEHLLFGHGGDLYREAIHVPLLLVPPASWDGPRGIRVVRPVSLRDVPATIAALSAPGRQAPFPGWSLSWTWNDGSTEPSSDVFAEVDLGVRGEEARGHAPALQGGLRALVSGGFTYIRSGDGDEELFALDDREEAENLAGSPDLAGQLDAMRSRLDRLSGEGG